MGAVTVPTPVLCLAVSWWGGGLGCPRGPEMQPLPTALQEGPPCHAGLEQVVSK